MTRQYLLLVRNSRFRYSFARFRYSDFRLCIIFAAAGSNASHCLQSNGGLYCGLQANLCTIVLLQCFFMNPYPTRIVIYVKDVMNITGRSERTARYLLFNIRKHFGKERGAFVTIEEFCEFTGMKREGVERFLV
jgi:hypothetical protein